MPLLRAVTSCPAEGALHLSIPGSRKRIPAWAVAAAVAVIFLGLVAYARLTGHRYTEIPQSIYMNLVPRANEFSHPLSLGCDNGSRMPTSSIDQITPPVGPNIVRAWFESAINPLLLGLENEETVLRQHTFTWREHNGRMLAIRSVHGHVPYGRWGNLEQFLSFYGNIAELCNAHDICVTELAQACQRMFEALLSNGEFREFVRGVLADQTQQSQHIVRLLAQHIVNGSGRPGSSYAIAAVWDPFREEFLAFRLKEPIRGLWEETDGKGQQLLELVDELISALKDARNSLSLKFDVPPEPLDERE